MILDQTDTLKSSRSDPNMSRDGWNCSYSVTFTANRTLNITS